MKTKLDDLSPCINNKAFKGMIKKAFDDSNKILSIKKQVSKMKQDPSSFGLGVIKVDKSLNFCGIFSNYIYFTYSDWIKHVNKHLSDEIATAILTDIKNKIVLAVDYYDKIGHKIKKTLLIDNQGDVYILGLKKGNIDDVEIDELSTLYGKSKNTKKDINEYINKMIFNKYNLKYKIYKNKKSNEFLTRFGISVASVDKIITIINLS